VADPAPVGGAQPSVQLCTAPSGETVDCPSVP
jgi:hypothetical protein